MHWLEGENHVKQKLSTQQIINTTKMRAEEMRDPEPYFYGVGTVRLSTQAKTAAWSLLTWVYFLFSLGVNAILTGFGFTVEPWDQVELLYLCLIVCMLAWAVGMVIGMPLGFANCFPEAGNVRLHILSPNGASAAAMIWTLLVAGLVTTAVNAVKSGAVPTDSMLLVVVGFQVLDKILVTLVTVLTTCTFYCQKRNHTSQHPLLQSPPREQTSVNCVCFSCVDVDENMELPEGASKCVCCVF